MKKFLPLLTVFLIILVVLPRSAKLSYDYRKGAPWKYETLIAPFDFPVLKTEDELLEERREAANNIVPYYKYQDDVVSRSIRGAESVDLGDFAYIRTSLVSSLKEVYER